MSLGTLGNLVVSLTAETSQFTGAMDRAAYHTNARMQAMVASAKAAGTVIAGGMVAAAASFAVIAKASIDAEDALGKMSQRTNISVETLAGLRLVANQADTSLDSLTTNVGRLQKFMGEADAGNTQYQATLQALGITARDPEQALIQLADATVGLHDPNQRAAVLTQILGRSYQEMLPLLLQGGEAMRANIEKGRELYQVTAKDAEQAALFNDQLELMKTIAAGAGIAITNPLLPAMNQALHNFEQAAKLAREHGGFISLIVKGVNPAGDAGREIENLRDRIRDLQRQKEGALPGADTSAFDVEIEKLKAIKQTMVEMEAEWQASKWKDYANYKIPQATGTDFTSLINAAEMQAQLSKAFDIRPMDDFLRNFQTRAKQIQREYDALVANLTGPSVEGATGGDISAELTKGRGALARGDQAGLQAYADRAKAMLQGLKDNGGITYEITYYAEQLKQLELSANEAAASVAKQTQSALEKTFLEAQQGLANMDPSKIKIDGKFISEQVKSAVENAMRDLADNPLAVPLIVAPRMGVSGGQAVDLSTLARSHGGR